MYTDPYGRLRDVPNRPRTTTKDWIEAGYAATGRGGFDAVTVEAIASELGVSKAGFYHRFKNRQALLDAVVDHWILRRQEHVDSQADVDEPGVRLREVVVAVLADDQLRHADAWILLRNPSDPAFAIRTQVVREQFKAFGKRQLTALGFGDHQAELRAQLLFTGYLGLVSDLVARPEPVGPRECRHAVDQLIDMVAAGAPTATPARREHP